MAANNDNGEREVSFDVVYEQAYEEMRRWRDYENRFGEWFSSIMLALVGALGGLLVYEKALFSNSCETLVATVFILVLSAAGTVSTYYGGWRHRQLRAWVTENLEPVVLLWKLPLKR